MNGELMRAEIAEQPDVLAREWRMGTDRPRGLRKVTETW